MITGGTGLVGTRLTELLRQRGHEVMHLSRRAQAGSVSAFTWDVQKGTLDERALNDVDAVIHLAGAGVADARWTAARKKEILDSRVDSTRLLQKYLANNSRVKTFIAASAIGYYGFTTADEWVTETTSPGRDFLADVTRQWEDAVDQLALPSRRVIKLRIGIVLSANGGALAEIAKPVRWGFGAPLGSGRQYMSWIHLDDVCAMFIHALENATLSGAYNAVAPKPATNRQVTEAIAAALRKPLWLPPVPAFVLRLALGEMALMVLAGSRISPEKIIQTGFRFTHTDLRAAVADLLGT